MPLRDGTFNGKVAIVTGSSSGIGAEIAVHLAQLGCSVSLHGRNETALHAVRDQCIGSGLRAEQIIFTVGDLSNDDVPKLIVDRTIEKFGRLDILVNNAAQPCSNSSNITSVEQFDVTMTVNVKSVLMLCELSASHLEQWRGNIVNISSVASTMTSSGYIPYGASKAALDNASKTLAHLLAPKGVRVNVINPGVIQTPVFKRLWNDDALVDKTLTGWKKAHATGTIGEPSDIAKAVAFLASNDDAGWITGVCLPVDGGALLMHRLATMLPGNRKQSDTD